MKTLNPLPRCAGAARDDFWRSVRSAWQPAFAAGSLSGYLPRMVGCAAQLADRLVAVARGGFRVLSGKARARPACWGRSMHLLSSRCALTWRVFRCPDGGRVDMWRELGGMTLQARGAKGGRGT
jgi:hypothetical protein